VQHVLIIHEVADYTAWKSIFNRAAGIRKAAGERSYQVLSYYDDPNKIVHFSAWTSIADARSFFESPSWCKSAPKPASKHPTSSTWSSWKPAPFKQPMRIDYSQIEPELTSRFRHLTRDLAQTSIAPNLRALVELRVSQINRCAYCIQLHQAEARHLGEDQKRLDQPSRVADFPVVHAP
jgi:AhpD family alkylhydroperoxidase